jgi:hypothetical protein
VFILYAVLIGLVLGLLLRGRVSGLAEIRFRWSGLVVAALLIQVVLFAEPVADRIPATLGVAVYIGSTAMALVGVLENLRIPGIPLVALGAASNLAAIIANGGYMPADPGALAALGRDLGDEYSNSTVVADPVLGPLTDIFAMPSWLPFANVFSIGDVLISAGVVVAMVVAMRRAAAVGRPAAGSSGATGLFAGDSSLLAQAWDRFIGARSLE